MPIPIMPDDEKGRPLPAHTPDPDGVVNIAFTDTTGRVKLPKGSIAIRIYTDEKCWYRLGDVTVEVSATNGTALPADSVELPISVRGHTYMAVIEDDTAGSMNITNLL